MKGSVIFKVGRAILICILRNQVTELQAALIWIKIGRTAIVIPIHKKGDRNNPANYRGISLLKTGYKIYSKIIAKRLTAIAEVLLLEEQNGFRIGRSCMDCIFSVSQIIEKYREFNIPTYIAFIDLKKAFDSVDRDK